MYNYIIDEKVEYQRDWLLLKQFLGLGQYCTPLSAQLKQCRPCMVIHLVTCYV